MRKSFCRNWGVFFQSNSFLTKIIANLYNIIIIQEIKRGLICFKKKYGEEIPTIIPLDHHNSSISISYYTVVQCKETYSLMGDNVSVRILSIGCFFLIWLLFTPISQEIIKILIETGLWNSLDTNVMRYEYYTHPSIRVYHLKNIGSVLWQQPNASSLVPTININNVMILPRANDDESEW